MTPSPAQRMMAEQAKARVKEARGHAIYVSRPADAAELLHKAADSSN